MKKTFGKNRISFVLALALLFAMLAAGSFNAYAENNPVAKRTIMFYFYGTNLEEESGWSSSSIIQILNSNFGDEENVRVIVLTGGCNDWHLDPAYCNAEARDENDHTEGIANGKMELWEAKGQGTAEKGKLHLLAAANQLETVTGISQSQSMMDPLVLQKFLDYCKANYPAEKYDLIMFDHGSGPVEGFGYDEAAGDTDEFMEIYEMMQAIHDSQIGKLDMLSFEACLMGSFEVALALSPFTDYIVASPNILGETYGEIFSGLNCFSRGEIATEEFAQILCEGAIDSLKTNILYSNTGGMSVISSGAITDSSVLDKAINMEKRLSYEANTKNKGEYLFQYELLSD